jgi:hypothetical protein
MRARLRAGLIDLALGAAAAAAVFLPIYFFWYPGALYDLAGGRDLFMLLAAIQLVVGPLLIAILYVPGKWGLRFDLVVIGTLQVLALAYGVYALFESRPVNIVFVKDRFELVRATDYPASQEGLSWTGPRIIGAKLPTDPKEQLQVMLSGIGGVDVHLMPRYYVPYDEVRTLARAKSEPLSTLRERNPARVGEIDALVAKSGRRQDELRFLPMRAGKVDLSAVIDAKSGEIVRISSLKPWGDV